MMAALVGRLRSMCARFAALDGGQVSILIESDIELGGVGA